MKTKKCKKCGFVNQGDSFYCVRCGAKLKTLNTWGLALVVIVPLAIIGFISAAALIMNRKTHNEQTVPVSSEQTVPDSNIETDDQYSMGMEAYKSHNYEEALEHYRKGAENGDSNSLFELGRYYYNGLIVDLDYEKAAEYFCEAAELNNEKAMYYCYLLHKNQWIENSDSEAAMDYLKASSEAGCPAAMMALADKYDSGEVSGNKDEEDELRIQARQRYTELAENNDTDAMVSLGAELIESLDENDQKEGIVWLEKASELADPNAMRLLGSIYKAGNIVPEDKEKAIDYFQKAIKEYMYSADRGHLFNGWGVGICYSSLSDLKVEGSDEKAIEWLTKVYKKGYTLAGQTLERTYGIRYAEIMGFDSVNETDHEVGAVHTDESIVSFGDEFSGEEYPAEAVAGYILSNVKASLEAENLQYKDAGWEKDIIWDPGIRGKVYNPVWKEYLETYTCYYHLYGIHGEHEGQYRIQVSWLPDEQMIQSIFVDDDGSSGGTWDVLEDWLYTEFDLRKAGFDQECANGSNVGIAVKDNCLCYMRHDERGTKEDDLLMARWVIFPNKLHISNNKLYYSEDNSEEYSFNRESQEIFIAMDY